MYPVTDMSRARRFYEEALGLKLARIMEEGGQAWAEYDLPGGTFAITTF
ncbi:MAG TPA: VOC family protein, partial [Nitrospiraceae bacterium]|nr:VOC family protein [Nitrospiraceae bacterium]